MTTTLTREAADDSTTMDALEMGITPRKVENAIRGNRIRAVGREYGLDQAQMRALAVRWGIVE